MAKIIPYLSILKLLISLSLVADSHSKDYLLTQILIESSGNMYSLDITNDNSILAAGGSST